MFRTPGICDSNCRYHLIHLLLIEQIENEDVVAAILSKMKPIWKVKLPARMKDWPRKGYEVDGLTKEESSCLIRCSPEDGMNGFFITVFEKVTPSTNGKPDEIDPVKNIDIINKDTPRKRCFEKHLNDKKIKYVNNTSKVLKKRRLVIGLLNKFMR
jgi:hypothetical protein